MYGVKAVVSVLRMDGWWPKCLKWSCSQEGKTSADLCSDDVLFLKYQGYSSTLQDRDDRLLHKQRQMQVC